ncbi:MAG TPA: shikimate kinase [Dehalococcoidales bacterium]|nr:shikimate kinase [Dehalococcoidales bacterium]
MKRNIALTGFMGSGKSAVGKVLAGRLGRRFVELDDVIEEMAGKSIPDIFRQDGEIAFRELEIEATRRVSKSTDMVIACGGGIVLNMINIDRLRETSRIVYLTASPGAILRRTRADDNERPLLDVPVPAERIRELLRFRRPFYERAADLRISTSRLSTDSVAERIISQLKEDEGFNL